MRLHAAAVQLGQCLDERQSEPQAALRPVHGLRPLTEGFEHVRQELGVNPRARVADADEGPVAVTTGTDADGPAVGRVLACIG